MSESATLPPLTMSPDVKAFAAEKGASAYLPGVLALAQRLFSGYPIDVRVEDDPELAYNRTIVFTVVVRGWDAERYLHARAEWVQGLFECCPAPLAHVFGLALMMVE